MDCSRKKIEKNYPKIFNENLPSWIGCPTTELRDVAKKAFERCCFKDATIVGVENIKNNYQPVCIWRVYYQRKNEEECKGGDPHTKPQPLELKRGDALTQFFQNITKHRPMSMEVWKKYQMEPCTVAVDYYCSECECKPQDFNSPSTAPQLWSVEDVESSLRHLKIINL